MRTIKFKGWDKKYKEIVENFYIDQNGDIRSVGYSNLGEPHELQNHRLEIMQYAGLKDKKEKEIYTSDIILIDNDKIEYEVIFMQGVFGIISGNSQHYSLRSFAKTGSSLQEITINSIKIIGNKYNK